MKSLKEIEEKICGEAWQGLDGPGCALLGMAQQSRQTHSRQREKISGEAGLGLARLGWARRGKARLGQAHQTHSGSDGPLKFGAAKNKTNERRT